MAVCCCCCVSGRVFLCGRGRVLLVLVFVASASGGSERRRRPPPPPLFLLFGGARSPLSSSPLTDRVFARESVAAQGHLDARDEVVDAQGRGKVAQHVLVAARQVVARRHGRGPLGAAVARGQRAPAVAARERRRGRRVDGGGGGGGGALGRATAAAGATAAACAGRRRLSARADGRARPQRRRRRGAGSGPRPCSEQRAGAGRRGALGRSRPPPLMPGEARAGEPSPGRRAAGERRAVQHGLAYGRGRIQAGCFVKGCFPKTMSVFCFLLLGRLFSAWFRAREDSESATSVTSLSEDSSSKGWRG